MSDRELPMFPLGTVLLPTVALPLHVFEDRYRALARHCVDGDGALGVVLIKRGGEVGGGDVRYAVGSCGRIVEAVELDDGRWVMLVVGEERIRIDRWLPEDPFPLAEVSLWPDVPAGPGAVERRDTLARLLRRVLALKVELGDPAVPATVELDADPAAATWQAAALAPLGPLDSQRVLETEGADERLTLVLSLLEDEVTVLAQRVAGG